MNNTDPLSRIAERIAAAKAAVDREFAHLVRNHLVQLFRLAHAIEPGLTGAKMGMGTAAASGTYTRTYEDTGERSPAQAVYWNADSGEELPPAVLAWFEELERYSLCLCSRRGDELPEVRDITLDDILTPAKPARKAVRRAG